MVASAPYFHTPLCPVRQNSAYEKPPVQAVTPIGTLIALLVILDGIYVVTVPPCGDELQGYALLAIGVFIILMSWQMTKNCDDSG